MESISRRKFLRLAGLAGGAGLLAACSSAPPAQSPTSVPAAPQPTAAPASAQSTAAPAAAPAKGATRDLLTVATSGEPGNLDATTSVLTPSRMLFEQIYDPLVHRTPDRKLVGKLAESWELVNDTTWRFRLRKGVKFTNGEDFNADSVKFSLEHLADPKSQASGTMGSFKEAKIVDPYTVDVITKAPDPLWIATLTDEFFMVPPKYYQEKGAEYVATHPVGTGPFVFKEWVKADHITLTANKDYWGGAPKVNTVIWRTIPEDATRIAALERGEVDIVTDIPPSLANDLVKGGKVNIGSSQDPNTAYVGFNEAHDAVKDLKVRQAMNYAVNRDLLVQKVLFGFATPAGQLATPISFGHNPDVKPYPYDPAKAKALLAEAGFKPGTALSFDAPIGGLAQSKEVAQALAADWDAVGIKVNINMQEYATMSSQKLLPKGHPNLGDIWMWWKRHPSTDAGETYNSSYLTGLPWNYGSYSRPKADEFTNLVATTMDDKKREQAMKDFAKFLYDDPPGVFLYWPQWIHGSKKGVDYKPRSDGLVIVYDEVGFSQ